MNMWFDIPKDGLLLPSIEKHLLLKQARSDRRLDCIHPSSMAHHDWCPRMEYFKLKGAKPSIDTVRFQMSNVFEEGHLIHRKWQQWLQEMNNLQGVFQCNWCRQSGWYNNTPVSCPGCNWKEWTYKEVPLYDDERMIAGHADGLTREGLIEIKSVGMGTLRIEEPGLFVQFKDAEELWRNLKRPMASHVRQASLYLALLKIMGRPVDTAIFLYEFKPTQAVKEFVITYSPEIAEPLLAKAQEIAACVRGELDHIPVCYTGKSCKKCEGYETTYRRTS